MNVIKIYEKIKSLKISIDETEDFKKGFDSCLFLFKTAFNKEESFNLHIENKKIKIENEELKKKVLSLEIKLAEEELKYRNIFSENFNPPKIISLKGGLTREYKFITSISKNGLLTLINSAKEVVKHDGLPLSDNTIISLVQKSIKRQNGILKLVELPILEE